MHLLSRFKCDSVLNSANVESGGMANVVAFSAIDLSDYTVEDPGVSIITSTDNNVDEVDGTSFSSNNNIVFSEINDVQDFVIDADSATLYMAPHEDARDSEGMESNSSEHECRDTLQETSVELSSSEAEHHHVIAPSVRSSTWGIGNRTKRQDAYEVASSIEDGGESSVTEDVPDGGDDRSISEDSITEEDSLRRPFPSKMVEETRPLRRRDGVRRVVAGPSLQVEREQGVEIEGPMEDDISRIDAASGSSIVDFHEDVESVPESNDDDVIERTSAYFDPLSSAGNASTRNGETTTTHAESTRLSAQTSPAIVSSHVCISMEDKSIQVGAYGIGTQVSYDEERRLLFDAGDVRERLIHADFTSWFSGQNSIYNPWPHASVSSQLHETAHAMRIPCSRRNLSLEADVTATAAEQRFFQRIDGLRDRLASLACGKDIT